MSTAVGAHKAESEEDREGKEKEKKEGCGVCTRVLFDDERRKGIGEKDTLKLIK